MELMKFTENFSEGTKLKAYFLEQIDLNEENQETWGLTNELIEQMVTYLLGEEERCRNKGMNEEDIQLEVLKRGMEILNTYKGNAKELQKTIDTLHIINEVYENDDEISQSQGR